MYVTNLRMRRIDRTDRVIATNEHWMKINIYLIMLIDAM